MAKFENLEDANVEIVNLENKISQLNELVEHYKESQEKEIDEEEQKEKALDDLLKNF